MRLLISYRGSLRLVANFQVVERDGSIVLVFVREQAAGSVWTWHSETGALQGHGRADASKGTKRITVHTSGRVNFHFQQDPSSINIPCLLDLVEPHLVVAYLVPTLGGLNLVKSRAGDHVVHFSSDAPERIVFQFIVVPASIPTFDDEILRVVIQGRYGLVCVASRSSPDVLPASVPPDCFVTATPTAGLETQAISEEEAFVRFKMLVHAMLALKRPSGAMVKTGDLKELARAIAHSPGLEGPDVNGVWSVICRVPMRACPSLKVTFAQAIYRAELCGYGARRYSPAARPC